MSDFLSATGHGRCPRMALSENSGLFHSIKSNAVLSNTILYWIVHAEKKETIDDKRMVIFRE